MCPRISKPFYIVSYYIKWVTTCQYQILALLECSSTLLKEDEIWKQSHLTDVVIILIIILLDFTTSKPTVIRRHHNGDVSLAHYDIAKDIDNPYA